MDEKKLLEKVKMSIGITGTFHDETLNGYIQEVKEFLKDAGVKDGVLDSDSITGIIARGVSDLWNYGAGGTTLSPYFMQRATQLCYREVVDNG